MFIVTHRKVFYIVSIILVLLSLGAVIRFGLTTGIDFKGGSLLEVTYTADRPEVSVVREQLEQVALGEYSVRPTGAEGYLFRLPELSHEQKNLIVTTLAQEGTYTITEKQFSSIGPMLGSESRNKSFISIALVLIAIVLFIAFAFRHVSKPISSWVYGIVAVVGLAHNIIIPTGLFAFLGLEVDTLFVTALLVVLGYSVHDTIVVFDRIRENLRRNENKGKEFDVIVGESISQTFVRSINTSLTIILPMIVLYLWGSDSTKSFVLALLVGVTAGAYSSIFVCSPLLVSIFKWKSAKVAKE